MDAACVPTANYPFKTTHNFQVFPLPILVASPHPSCLFPQTLQVLIISDTFTMLYDYRKPTNLPRTTKNRTIGNQCSHKTGLLRWKQPDFSYNF